MGALFDAAGTEGAFVMKICVNLKGSFQCRETRGLCIVLLAGQLSKAEFSLWIL